MGLPVGVRANLATALSSGRFDVVHGFEPGLPSLSYLALRDARALTVASFFSPERLVVPAREGATRETAGPNRRARRRVSRGGSRCGAAVSRGVPDPVRGSRPAALLARREASAGRARVAPHRTTSLPRGRPGDARAVRLGARLPADEAARGPADDPGQAARPRVRPHCPGREEQGADSERGLDLRPRARRPLAGRARGGGFGCRDRVTSGSSGAAGAGRGRSRAPRRERVAAQEALRRIPAQRRGQVVRGRGRRARRALRGPRQAAQASTRAGAARPTASGSSPTSTCTRPGRATARSRSRTCSTTRRRPGSGRSRSPTTTSSAARSRRSSSPATAT